MKKILAVLFLASAVALPAAAQGLGGLLEEVVQVPLPLLNHLTGELTVGFENATNATPANLGITTRQVSPLDLGLLLRLPPLTSLLGSVPILVRIEPPPAGGLLFEGVSSVTYDLPQLPLVGSLLNPVLSPLLASLPVRLYSAPLGGPFSDITSEVDGGDEETHSYRVIGSKGGFSEFLLVLDLTPLNTAAANKITRLAQTLNDNAAAITPSVASDLQAQLATLQADYQVGNVAAATADTDAFAATVEAHSGSDIPDVWRSTHDLVNVAGLLRAGAATLRFSLQQLGGPTP
jgi:hypothetical protein